MTLAIQSAEPEHAIEMVAIERIDRSVQVRVKTDARTVDDYHRAMIEMEEDPSLRRFPPVVLFREKKTGVLYLADGNHRLEARSRISAEIEAEIREGGKREALAYAIGSSKGHGLRFSNADKRKAVTLAFKDSKLKKMSDNQLSALIGVSQPFVSKLRGEAITVITPPSDDAAPAEPSAPPEPTTDRFVARFRKLLGEVPDAERAAFSEQVLSVLSGAD